MEPMVHGSWPKELLLYIQNRPNVEFSSHMQAQGVRLTQSKPGRHCAMSGRAHEMTFERNMDMTATTGNRRKRSGGKEVRGGLGQSKVHLDRIRVFLNLNSIIRGYVHTLSG